MEISVIVYTANIRSLAVKDKPPLNIKINSWIITKSVCESDSFYE